MSGQSYPVSAAPLGTVDTPYEITVARITGNRKSMTCFWCGAPAFEKVSRSSGLDQQRRTDPACRTHADDWARRPGARDLRDRPPDQLAITHSLAPSRAQEDRT